MHMLMLSRLVVAALVAVSTMLLVPAPSYACSCAGSPLNQLIRGDEVVFRGTISSRERSPFSSPSTPLDEVVYTVDVAAVFQGEVGAVAEVDSAASGSACGLEVQQGREYVIVATPTDGGRLSANLCGGTSRVTPEHVAQVTALLGQPGPPDLSVDAPPDWTALAPLVLGAALPVLTGVLAVLSFRT